MLEAVDIVAVAIDREGRITFANPHVCRLLGRTQEELLGLEPVDACVPTEERAQAARTVRQRRPRPPSRPSASTVAS